MKSIISLPKKKNDTQGLLKIFFLVCFEALLVFVVLIDAIHRMTQSVPRRTQTLRDDYTKKKKGTNAKVVVVEKRKKNSVLADVMQ